MDERAGDGIALKWTKRTAERGREDGRAVSKFNLDAINKVNNGFFISQKLPKINQKLFYIGQQLKTINNN